MEMETTKTSYREVTKSQTMQHCAQFTELLQAKKKLRHTEGWPSALPPATVSFSKYV